MFADAAAVRAQHADGMGFVDHQQGLVPLLDLDEPRQVGKVAVHAVDAFDGDQHAAVFAAELRQQLIERLPIVVREGPPPGAGRSPLHDAVVGQRVVQDQVAGAEQVADRRFVGRVAADEDDRIFDAEEFGDRPLQLAVDRLSRPRPAGWPRRWCRSGRWRRLAAAYDRIARHADVVVAGEVDQLAAVDDRACRW